MDKTRQGILYNHDNDFLHYEDDWYTPLVVVRRGWRANYYQGPEVQP